MRDTAYKTNKRVEYFHELISFAHRASKGDRIAVATLAFDPSTPLIDEIVRELTAAAGRGADVILWVDAFSFMSSGIASINISANAPEPFASRLRALEAVRKQGGAYVITNKPTRQLTFSKASRSHIKFAVLNDRVYIGGNNLEKPEQIDLMVSWQDEQTADYLFTFARDVVRTGSPRSVLQDHDAQRQLSGKSTLLIDAGVPKQSIILDQALQLIDDAKEWIFMTCQYFPGGRTGQHLATAMRRGVHVALHYSPPSTHGKEAPGHYSYEILQRLQLPSELFTYRLPSSHPKLHAKVLATEQGAMIGSHNYVVQGVRFGTAEIALRSDTPAFSDMLRSAIQRQIET